MPSTAPASPNSGSPLQRAPTEPSISRTEGARVGNVHYALEPTCLPDGGVVGRIVRPTFACVRNGACAENANRAPFLLRCAPLTHPNTCYTSSMILGLGVSPMRRREFIALISSGVAAWPLAAHAQQPSKLPMIGVIGGGTPSTHGQWIAGFVQRLRELGWIEDRTVAIEIRWAEGRNERYTEIAAEFVRRKVDVILTSGAAVPAAKQATSVIPIVFSAANDPLGAGFVASLARPGGNITGLSMQNTDSASKRLELLREVVVGLRRLAILTNVSYGAAVAELREAHATARASGLEVITLEIQRSEDVAPAFEALNDPIGALYVCSDPLTLTNRIRINTLALSARLPTIYGVREFVEAGGLMSYGPNFLDLYRRSASYVDKILRGTKPADIPVEQPTKFDFIVNLLTAKALRLTIPPTLLARADEVIE